MSNVTTNHLITAVLESKEVSLLKKVNRVIFNDIDRGYVNWIFDYIAKYHEVPTLNLFTDEFPTFLPTAHDGTPKYIFDVVSKKLIDDYIKATLRSTNVVTKDVLDQLQLETTIAQGKSLLYNDVDPDRYITDQVSLEVMAPFIQLNIGQIMGSDFILIVGMQKNQKTHISMLLLLDLLRNYNGIVYTNEITDLQYAAKLDAIVAGHILQNGFNSRVFRDKKMFEANKDHVVEALKQAAEYRKTHLHKLKIISGLSDISEMYADLETCDFPPGFTMIDGVHLVGGVSATTSDKAQSMRTVSNGLKAFARSTEVPVIGISQNKRPTHSGKPDANDIGLSAAFAQDVQAAYACTDLGPNAISGQKPSETVVEILPVANRDGGQIITYLKTDWSTTSCKWMPPKALDDDDDEYEV